MGRRVGEASIVNLVAVKRPVVGDAVILEISLRQDIIESQ
jgi:hypothetical protein